MLVRALGRDHLVGTVCAHPCALKARGTVAAVPLDMARCGFEEMQQLMDLSLEKGTLTAADCDRLGIDRQALIRGTRQGYFRRTGRGRYRYRQCPDDHHPDDAIQELLARKPGFVLVGPSAAHFHGLIPEPPPKAYVALSRGVRRPKLDGFRFVYFSGDRLIDWITPLERNLCVSDPAKAVAECFYFRKELDPKLPFIALANYSKVGCDYDVFPPARLFKVSKWVALAIKHPLKESELPPSRTAA